MSIEIQCMTEKLIVKTIKLDYLKVPSKSTVPCPPMLKKYLPLQKYSLFGVIIFTN